MGVDVGVDVGGDVGGDVGVDVGVDVGGDVVGASTQNSGPRIPMGASKSANSFSAGKCPMDCVHRSNVSDDKYAYTGNGL